MANWTQQTSPTVFNLTSVFGIAADNVYACGDSGTILHWNGSAWATETLPPPLNGQDYTGIWVAPSGNVYAVSRSGGHLAKKIGGVWTDMGSPFSASPIGIGGTSDNDFYVTEDNEGTLRIQHSTNGGSSFSTVQDSNYDHTVAFIRPFNANNVYEVRGQYLNQWNGAVWTERNYFPTITTLKDIWLYAADSGYAVDNNTVWSFASRGAAIIAETMPGDGNFRGRTIFGTSLSNMFVAGFDAGTSALRILKTTDSGSTWVDDTVDVATATPTQMWMDSVTGAGFVVADSGQIFSNVVITLPSISADADVMAQDLVTLKFAAPVRNSSTLRSPASYKVVVVSGGPNTATVTEVQAGTDAVVDTVYLWVTGVQVGVRYKVQTIVPIQQVDGTVVDVLSPEFIGRITKIDSMVSSRPQLYDMSSTSVLRKILQAIGQEDERIGGSRNDRIQAPVATVTPPPPVDRELQMAVIISPYSVVMGLAQSYVYCLKYQLPLGIPMVNGKLQFEIGLANHDGKAGTNPGGYTMLGLASGQPNVAGDGWATGPDQVRTNLAVTGDGKFSWFTMEATPDADNNVLIAYQFNAGANVAYEFGDGAAQIYGFVDVTGTTNVNALAGMAAVNGSTRFVGGNIAVRYLTSQTRLVVLSDSIPRGIQYDGVESTTVKFNAAASRQWAVGANGIASTTAQMWANPAHWAWDQYVLNNNHVLIALGENDIALGRSHAQLLADLTAIVGIARSKGALSVGMYTVTPNTDWTAPQNLIRDQIRTDVMAKTPGNDWFGDVYTAVRDIFDHDAVDPAFGGPIHLNSDGQDAENATIPLVL